MEIIFGAVTALLVQALKKWGHTRSWVTMAAVVLISLSAAGIYTWLKSNGYWESFANILVIAGAVHNYILRRFE